MTEQHTPAPWVLEDRGYKFIVHKSGDGYITRDICRMDSSTMAAFNQEANARLIAAAPDMLDALKIAKKFIEIASDWNIDGAEIEGEMRSTYDWLAVIQAAIAKATGEMK